MAINVLGIDIGSYAAKVVTLGNIKGNRANLMGLGMAQLPTREVLNWEEDPAPAKTAISQAMKNLVARLKLKGRYVSTSVSGDSIVVKKINMPAMPPMSLRAPYWKKPSSTSPFPFMKSIYPTTFWARTCWARALPSCWWRPEKPWSAITWKPWPWPN